MTLLSQSVASRGPKPKDFFPIRSLFSPLFFLCAVVLCTILLSWTTALFPSIPFMAAAMNVRNEVRPLSPEGRYTRGERGDHPLRPLPPLLHTIPEIIRVVGCGMESHSMPDDLLKKRSFPDSLSVSSSGALRCVVPRMPKEERHLSTTPSPALTLSIRGRNFPFSSPSHAEDNWSVELQESESSAGVGSHVPPEGEERTTDSSSPLTGSSFSSLRRLSCALVVPSTLFPSQLFTCVIPSLPSSFFSPVASTRTSSTSTTTTTVSSVWMDAFLVRRRPSAMSPMRKERGDSEEAKEEKNRDVWEVVAVRRAAVELIDADSAEDKNVSLHPSPPPPVGDDEHARQDSRPSHHDNRHTVEKQEDGASEENEAESGNFSSLHSTSPLERLEEVYRGGDHIWAELGVGGLHATLHTLLRRVFLSRFPSLHSVVHSLSLEPVRGVILHGPSGTGKTLIARSLIDVLGPSAHVTIVHSTDILSKFVGESEQKLEQLFAQSMAAPWEVEEEEEEEEEEVAGASGGSPDSSTASTTPKHHRKKGIDHAYFPHVIIIDELETLFVRRNGNRDGSSAGWLYESVTNTLLSLMDGLNTQRTPHPSGGAIPSAYHNVLVIGITNRVEVLDPALLRPGRFEVVLEIPSPDRDALEEIFMIHTAALQQHGFLAPDVVSSEMADRMFGFTGAEVAGVTRAAISVAMESHVRETNARTRWNHSGRNDDDEEKDEEKARFLVRREHFMKSIAEIRHSTARQEDPYHCWGPPLTPSFHSSFSHFFPASSSSSSASSFPLAGGLPMRRLLSRPSPNTTNRTHRPSHRTTVSLPAFVVDYSGHLLSRLEAVVDFWYSLHPFSSLSSSVVIDHRQGEVDTTDVGSSPSPTMEDRSFLSFPPTGSAGVVAVEGAEGNGKTAVLRYLHDRFRRAARLATGPSLSVSSSSLFHSRYLDCQSVLAWSKQASIEEMTSRVEEWLKRAENLLRDGPDAFGTTTTTASLSRSPATPRHVVVMVDGFDHLLVALRPYPTLEASLRNAMYHFVTSCRQGVSLSSYPTSHLLLLTSSRSMASLLPDLLPDMTVTLPLLSRVDLQKRVLHSFLITPTKEEEEEEEEEERRRKNKDVQRVLLHDSEPKKETEKPSEGSGAAPLPAASSLSASHPTASSFISSMVARSYPSSMTFTTFLQLTEKALRQSIAKSVGKRVDRTTPEDEEGSVPPSSSSLSSSDSPQKEAPRSATSIRWPRYGASVASVPSNFQEKEENPSHNVTANDEAVVAIRHRDGAAFFAQEVLSVSAEMGLLYG